MESIRSLEGFVDQVIKHFLEKMKSQTEKPFDLGEWLALFAIGQYSLNTFSRTSPLMLLLNRQYLRDQLLQEF